MNSSLKLVSMYDIKKDMHTAIETLILPIMYVKHDMYKFGYCLLQVCAEFWPQSPKYVLGSQYHV